MCCLLPAARKPHRKPHVSCAFLCHAHVCLCFTNRAAESQRERVKAAAEGTRSLFPDDAPKHEDKHERLARLFDSEPVRSAALFTNVDTERSKASAQSSQLVRTPPPPVSPNRLPRSQSDLFLAPSTSPPRQVEILLILYVLLNKSSCLRTLLRFSRWVSVSEVVILLQVEPLASLAEIARRGSYAVQPDTSDQEFGNQLDALVWKILPEPVKSALQVANGASDATIAMRRATYMTQPEHGISGVLLVAPPVRKTVSAGSMQGGPSLWVEEDASLCELRHSLRLEPPPAWTSSPAQGDPDSSLQRHSSVVRLPPRPQAVSKRNSTVPSAQPAPVPGLRPTTQQSGISLVGSSRFYDPGGQEMPTHDPSAIGGGLVSKSAVPLLRLPAPHVLAAYPASSSVLSESTALAVGSGSMLCVRVCEVLVLPTSLCVQRQRLRQPWTAAAVKMMAVVAKLQALTAAVQRKKFVNCTRGISSGLLACCVLLEALTSSLA
jgi:hypothetical protein